MKSFFKNNLFAVLVTVLAYALSSSPASAQTKTSFPAVSGITITGVAVFGGTATNESFGPNTFGGVRQNGSGKMDIVIGATGNGCTSGCGNTPYSVNGQANQSVSSFGGAWAKQPGTVGVSSLGRAEAAVGVTVTPAGQ